MSLARLTVTGLLIVVLPGCIARGSADCSAAGPRTLPDDTSEESSTLVSLDADSRADRFVLYTPPGRDAAHLRVETSQGVVIDRVSEWWTNYPRVVGKSDLNNDGRPEVWVDDRMGNTAHHVGLVVFDGCNPMEVLDANGYVAGFLYTATGNAAVGQNIGVACVDADGDKRVEIVEWEWQDDSDVPDSFERWDHDAWSYVAHRLVGRRTSVIARDEGTDLERRPKFLGWNAGLSCEDATYSWR